jgi:hypothetical protein
VQTLRNYGLIFSMALIVGACGSRDQSDASLSQEPNSNNEVTELHLLLAEHLRILDTLSRYSEEGDLVTLQRLVRQGRNVVSSMVTRGIAHRETSRQFDVLQITLQDSQFFLESIGTEYTKAGIARLKEIAITIEAKVGSPASSQITAIVFGEVQKRLQDIGERDVSEQLRIKIKEFTLPFAELIPVALAGGDVPATYKLSAPLCKRMTEELYPLLQEIDQNSKHFALAIDLIGLIEGYKFRIRNIDGT